MRSKLGQTNRVKCKNDVFITNWALGYKNKVKECEDVTSAAEDDEHALHIDDGSLDDSQDDGKEGSSLVHLRRFVDDKSSALGSISSSHPLAAVRKNSPLVSALNTPVSSQATSGSAVTTVQASTSSSSSSSILDGLPKGEELTSVMNRVRFEIKVRLLSCGFHIRF